MPTTVARLLSSGVYFTNTYFDEVTYSVNKITPTGIFSSTFDEVTIQQSSRGLAKRETSNGNLLVSGYFDEVTGISFIGSTVSTVTPTLCSSTSLSAISPFVGGGNSYNIQQAPGIVGNNLPTGGAYQYITVPGSTGFAFSTGDFTIEWFEYQTYANSFPRRFWLGTGPSWGFDIEGSTAYFWSPGFTNFGTTSVTSNTWTHWAIVRIGTTAKLYKNGVQAGNSVTLTTNFTDNTSTLYIGGKPSGYISEQFVGAITNVRICNGIGVYTGNFTVPTSPLGQTQSANPYGGSNTSAINSGQCSLLLNP